MSLELEKIGEIFKDSLQHYQSPKNETVFTHEQLEGLTEALKAALEEYHKQTK